MTNTHELHSENIKLSYNKKATICKDYEFSFGCQSLNQ